MGGFIMSKKIFLLIAVIASIFTFFSEVEAAVTNVKVGFIFLHDEKSTYDANFMNAAKIACENAGVEYIFKTNIPETEVCYETAVELVNQGCNIIFADSFGHEEFLIKTAKQFQHIQFCHATGTRAHNEGLSNYHNVFASIYEGRYLSGIAAGMKLNEMIENGKINKKQARLGYIGAFPYSEVISGYTAFFLGARSICPSAKMDVVFTNSWYDYELEAKSAEKLIKRGCVIISQHADSMGAPSVCEK
ncbi:MAG: BMP family ABC transporter substrate-binding protein, partial [Selenomonadaceae bacterium]|nr:BMP family ABC transporter substrate-binding protein [Selenomonadaceae bacterium]